jgi:hypothetical protein
MFHDERLIFRIKKQFVKPIKKCVKKNQVKYDSIGHFCRIAVIQLLKKEGVIDEIGRIRKN